MKKVAQELEVRYVLSGSVRKSGERIRISALLVDGASGEYVWADRYDRNLEDLFTLQDEIAQTIAGNIEPTLAKAEAERANRKSAGDLNAWELLQRGIHHWNRHTKQDFLAAKDWLEKAIDAAPDLSAAYSILSQLYYLDSIWRIFNSPENSAELSLSYARTAVDAIRELTRLGLEPGLMANGVEAREFAYFNRHGQDIFREPCGRFAGYQHRHFSIHRADLHKVLYDAVVDRLGAGAVHLGHRCAGVEQDAAGVTVQFDDAAPITGSIAIAADGFHSAVRRQFYPAEGGPQFGGINMWRGVTRRKPFLTGASVTRIGTVSRGKMVVYPIRQFDDGSQLINWTSEQPRDDHKPNDWATPGRIEDFIEPFQDWRFDWLDVPELIADAEFILEYPMVDRNPIKRWTFGRVTLLGDAAHSGRQWWCPGHSRRGGLGKAACGK